DDRLRKSMELAQSGFQAAKLRVGAGERNAHFAQRLRLRQHSDHRDPADAERLGDGALGHLLDEIHPGRALPEALAAPGRARALLAGGIPGHGFRIWLTIVRRAPRAAQIGGSSVFAWRTNAAASVLSNRQTLLEHH